jgi:hypothetical protein
MYCVCKIVYVSPMITYGRSQRMLVGVGL